MNINCHYTKHKDFKKYNGQIKFESINLTSKLEILKRRLCHQRTKIFFVNKF